MTSKLFFKYCVIYILLFISIASCNHNSKHVQIVSFYYWKQAFRLTGMERQYLDSLGIQKLYIKFFDIDWDNNRQVAVPKAILRIEHIVPRSVKHIIPVVFITNKVMKETKQENMVSLAQEASHKINEEWNTYKNKLPAIAFSEVQIDCDWTISTKEKYFLFLKLLQKELKGVELSCTIRLHQVKYVEQTGVPPVHTGTLMCYNMQSAYNLNTDNSIFKTAVAKDYLKHISSYPLSLNIAYPLFNWVVWFRQHHFYGLIYQSPISAITQKDKVYIFKKDTSMDGYKFIKGDLLRYEKADLNDIRIVNDWLRQRKDYNEIIFYHLDSSVLHSLPIIDLRSFKN